MWKTVGANLGTYRNYPRIVGETGGKDFIVAHPSADVDALATAIVRGSFEYQGQKCSAASRVFAPSNLWPELRERLVKQVRGLRMGDVSDFSNFVGAVIDGSSFATLAYFDGCDDGARPAAALVEDGAGNLYVTTTGGGLCVVGQGTLFELSVGCAPQLTAQPASQVVLAGTKVMLSVAAFGARPFFYQWQKNGTNLVDAGTLAGATSRNLALGSASLADAGTYSVIVSNALGWVPSTGAHLTVVYPPALLSTVQSNCTLTLTWSAMAGQQYRLQYKPALATTNWTNLGSLITATGTVATATDNVCTSTQRFYRVVMFPQVR